jgi:hypothetical protein
MNNKCPTCDSPQPHFHPSIQFEGEVEPCDDPFHRTVTPSNTAEMISIVDRMINGRPSRQGSATMTGKELVAEAARRATDQCPHAEYPGACMACIQHEFARFAELVATVRLRVEQGHADHCRADYPVARREPCTCLYETFAAALAEVEKGGQS